jgi:sugar diacid utilization regulator/putative methionine-R-sulfoxide reductase with GAF domain
VGRSIRPSGGDGSSLQTPGRTATDRLKALETVATDILSHLDLEATLLSVINGAVSLLGADIAGILLADGDSDLRMRACRGHWSIESVRLVAQRGQGVAGKVFETGKPCRVDDYPGPTISTHFKDLAQLEDARSALGCPMIVRGQVIGAVMAWSRQPAAFTATDEEALTGLANLATIAIENARLYDIERTAVRRLEEANQRLTQQFDLLSRAFSVHGELTELVLSGGKIADLVDTVARHTGGGVAVLDADLQDLAILPGADSVAVRARRHLEKARPYPQAAFPRAAVLKPAGRWTSWLLIRPAAAGGEVLGFLCVTLDHQPGDLDPVIVEQAGTVCALELTKERAVMEAHTRVRSHFVWDLLDGNIDAEGEAVARARYLGYVLSAQPRVVLISIDGLAAWARESGSDAKAVDRRREALVSATQSLASSYGIRRPLIARRGPTIAIILPNDPRDATERSSSWPADANRARAFAEHVVRGLGAANPELRFAAGVSAPSAGSANLRQASGQAESALASIRQADPAAPVALFDGLGVLRFLLMPGDRDEIDDFARRVLGPVLDYQAKYSTDLMQTLETFLAENCSLRSAAKRLGVHPKTIRYRLSRVEQLTKLDLAAQQDRFDAQLAATIIRALAIRDTGH